MGMVYYGGKPNTFLRRLDHGDVFEFMDRPGLYMPVRFDFDIPWARGPGAQPIPVADIQSGVVSLHDGTTCVVRLPDVAIADTWRIEGANDD